jgi:hypothetical protein
VSHRILCQGLALIADLPGITATVVAAGVSILGPRMIMLMTAHGGSSSRQEMGDGDFVRSDGGCTCSCMSSALISIPALS